MQEQQVIVGEYENEFDAEIAKGHLRASGIPASIYKDDGGCMLPPLQNSGGVQVVVAPHLKVKAKKILKVAS